MIKGEFSVRKFISGSVIAALGASALFTFGLITSATANSAVISTCKNISSGQVRIASDKNPCHSASEGTLVWHEVGPVNSSQSAGTIAIQTLTTCQSKNGSQIPYVVIRPNCHSYQDAHSYQHVVTPPEAPSIISAQALDFSTVAIRFAIPSQPADAPIVYYTLNVLPTGAQLNIQPGTAGLVYATNLAPLTQYKFALSATNGDGVSALSTPSDVVTTPARPPLPPAFSLSSTSEVVTAGNTITGYTITNTGGPVAEYSISPAAPTGMTFDLTTGLLTGAPTDAFSATDFTITAHNISGSASALFTLTSIDFGVAGPTTVSFYTLIALLALWFGYQKIRRRKILHLRG